MNSFTLAALHRKSVAVEVVVKGCVRLLFGHGNYESDAEQGSRLMIKSTCSAGYELELHEPSWHGKIHPGKLYGCDYFLRIV